MMIFIFSFKERDMKKTILIIILIMMGMNPAYGQDAKSTKNAKGIWSASFILGSGVNSLDSGENGVLLDDDNDDDIFYEISVSDDEWEESASWNNLIFAGQYRQGIHGFEIESFSASTDEIDFNFEYKVNRGNFTRTETGTIEFEFSGIGFSYLYYPEITKDKKLQPFIKFGNTIFTETTKTNLLGIETTKEISSSGSVFGGGFEYLINDRVSILVGTRLYSATEGAFYAFNDLGIRVNF